MLCADFRQGPSWAEAMGRVNRYVMNDLGGGQRVLKPAWVINFQKLTTIPLLGFFIGWYHNTRPEAWIYFAMRSSYGLVWIGKDFAFPDSNFHKRITIGAGGAFSRSWAGIGCSAGYSSRPLRRRHTRCRLSYSPGSGADCSRST